MPRRKDWFGDPPGPAGDPTKIEDGACRAILRRANVSLTAFARLASVDPASKLTFAQLEAFVDFPVVPVSTAASPGPPVRLLSDFAESPLLAAWLGFEDEDPPAMVFKGSDWGYGVFYPAPSVTPPDRSFLRLLSPERRVYVAETLAAWVAGLGWDGGGLSGGRPPRGRGHENESA